MIGILGGTFDPIHYGHLRTALDVLQSLQLDEVRFIPLRDPPHREQPQSTPEQRLAMVEAAIADQPGFVVDTRELEREEVSYTVDTLTSLRHELGSEVPICLLLGTDAFRGFPSWHKPLAILNQAHLVIMQRPGEDAPHSKELDELMEGRAAGTSTELKNTPGGKILFQTVTQLEISATMIRGLIKQGKTPRFLLPQSVMDIIDKHQLYR